jgi:hypothetical protein
MHCVENSAVRARLGRTGKRVSRLRRESPSSCSLGRNCATKEVLVGPCRLPADFFNTIDGKRTSARNMLVACSVDHASRQIAPNAWVEHPEIDAHTRVCWICRRPVSCAATGAAVPKVEGTITLPIGHSGTFNAYQIG